MLQFRVRISPEHIDAVNQLGGPVFSSHFCTLPVSWQNSQDSSSLWAIFRSMNAAINEPSFSVIIGTQTMSFPWSNHDKNNENTDFCQNVSGVRCSMSTAHGSCMVLFHLNVCVVLICVLSNIYRFS